ncbi:oxidoreductase [Purpureocillium lavendulum]|uniref:Oxidoreductase n=1 Tax=Purpureocillium lavendulum TaxID=1247861 RepID=A0AB34FRB4_9HYPO|nr:oxidoreductase [Purpureocillium lavendulum]
MASKETTSLPIIDFAKIVGPSISRSPEVIEESELEQRKLFQAFVDVGFCYLANHSIPSYAQGNLFSHAKRFFALPESEKAKVETGESKGFHGWFSPSRTSGDSRHSDLKEAFDVGKEDDPTRPNQWPEDWPEFKDDMNFFFEKCHEVHLVLLRALAQQVGIEEDFFEPHVNERDHFFRVIYYPETDRASFKDRLRASAHTDYGTLTLLFNDDSGGLQVRRTDGTYIEAPPVPGCAIINVGDLLSRWFNDKLISTEHRVVEPEPKANAQGEIPSVVPARYSIAWFGHPNRNALVEPLEACCTAENPKKYGPVFAGKHVVERLAYLHKKGQNTTTWTDKMQRDKERETVAAAPGVVLAAAAV